MVFWAPLPQGHQFQSVQSVSVNACQCWRAAWLLWNLAIRGRTFCCWVRGMSGCWMRKILTLAQTCMSLLRVPGPEIGGSLILLGANYCGPVWKRPWPVDPVDSYRFIPIHTDSYPEVRRVWTNIAQGRVDGRAAPVGQSHCRLCRPFHLDHSRPLTLYVYHITVYRYKYMIKKCNI